MIQSRQPLNGYQHLSAGIVCTRPAKSTAGLRTLATPQWLLDMLATHLAARGPTAGDADALVFVNRSGGPLNYTAWRRTRWARACRAAGLATLRFHDLRSVAASAMLPEGVDVKTAQHRLGHANASLTMQIRASADATAGSPTRWANDSVRGMDTGWFAEPSAKVQHPQPDSNRCCRRERAVS
jgi:integrase